MWNYCLFILFIYFWLLWVFRCCAWAFSSCSEQGLLFIAVRELLIAVASLVAEHRLQTRRLSSCGMWAQQLWLVGSRAQAQQLWCTGLVAQRPVGSSQTRAQTCVPCIGRWILNHCATREVPTTFTVLSSRCLEACWGDKASTHDVIKL